MSERGTGAQVRRVAIRIVRRSFDAARMPVLKYVSASPMSGFPRLFNRLLPVSVVP